MSPTPRERTLLLAVCAVALLLRLLVVWQCADARLLSDMQEYYDRALYVLAHGQLVPDAFRPPAYPVFLAACAWLFGDAMLPAARVAQALLGTLNVALAGLLAERVAGRRAGLIAAGALAVYPAWLLYPVYLMAETLFTSATLLGLWLWTRWRSWPAAVLAGVALAVAVQARAVGVATVAGLCLAALVDVAAAARRDGGRDLPPPRVTVTRVALLLAGFTLALAPWTMRNARLYGAFIPTDTASGYNFLLGNNPEATGRLELDQLPAITARYWPAVEDDAERSAIGMRAGLAFIRAQPGPAAVLTLRKLGYLVGLEGREHAWGYSYFVQGRHTPAVVWAWGLALLVSFPLLMVAALAGLLRPGLWDNRTSRTLAIVLLVATLLHLASFGESRFHVPWVPLLAVMAGGLAAGGPRWSAPRRACFAALVLGLLVLWSTQAPGLVATLARLAPSTQPLGLPY